MNIVCFLHSHSDTGEYLGFDFPSDIFEFNGSDLSAINESFNQSVKELIPIHIWENVKDSAFRIEFEIDHEGAYPTRIEQLNMVYP